MKPDTEFDLLHALAEFRHTLRQFLQASEQAAIKSGLHPQQHQLLLQIAGASPDTPATIAYAAERLTLRHNSTVELVNRSVDEGLIIRKSDPVDGRRVLLEITPKGRHLLQELTAFHARELDQRGPDLVAALTHIQQTRRTQAHS